VSADDWTVVAERTLGSQLGEEGAELLYLEAVLTEEGIVSRFDPFRPGDEITSGFSGPPHIKLMVTRRDFDRARQVIDDLEGSQPSAAESAESPVTWEEENTSSAIGDGPADGPSPDPPAPASPPPPLGGAIQPGCCLVVLGCLRLILVTMSIGG
jgi:hypothetical protein